MARTQSWLKHFYINVNNPYDMYITDDLDSEGTLSAVSDTEECDDHLLDENSGLLDENSCLLDGNNSVLDGNNGLLDENSCLRYENNSHKDSPSNDTGTSSNDFTLPIMHLEGRIRILAQVYPEPAKLLVEPTPQQCRDLSNMSVIGM